MKRGSLKVTWHELGACDRGRLRYEDIQVLHDYVFGHENSDSPIPPVSKSVHCA